MLWASAVMAQTIEDLGPVAAPTLRTLASISQDGSAFSGYLLLTNPSFPPKAFQWTSGIGYQDLILPAGMTGSRAYGMSADGSVIVGAVGIGSNISKIVRWTDSGAVEVLQFAEPAYSSAIGVSPNGQITVGRLGITVNITNHRAHLYKWPAGQAAPTDLGALAGTDLTNWYNEGVAVTNDGNVIVGNARYSPTADYVRAFRWTPQSGIVAIKPDYPAYVTGMSADGSVVVGNEVGQQSPLGFRWTLAEGVVNLISPGGGRGIANSVSADGTIVVGGGGGSGATMWSSHLGAVDLNAYLPTRGVDLSGWYLSSTALASRDGLVLVGTGTKAGVSGLRGWRVTLPCYIGAQITSNPENTPTCPSGSASFTVAATGGTLSYQWRKGDVPISDGAAGGSAGGVYSGATTATLTIAPAPGGFLNSADAGQFDCIVSNPCGSATSSAAALAVCLADFDCNGFINGVDFDSFVDLFVLGDPGADIDHDGFVSGVDFDSFTAAFEAGC